MSAPDTDQTVRDDRNEATSATLRSPDYAAFEHGVCEHQRSWYGSLVSFLRGRGPNDVAIVLGMLAPCYYCKFLASEQELSTGALVGILTIVALNYAIVALALVLSYKTHVKNTKGSNGCQTPDTRYESGDT
ncbi:MAG: hypothetical protein IIC02_10910 [Planctomycetes bacterium]|nr:hypothetical protein [Planctomycetota bacterium]